MTKLDSLARSVKYMHDIMGEIPAIGAPLKIIGIGTDTNTHTGKLMLNVLAGVAEWELSIMKERQREGIH